MYMLLTSTFILIVYNNSAALTSTPNIISSVNIAPKRGMPLDYIYRYLHLSDYVYLRSLCPEALCLKPFPFA